MKVYVFCSNLFSRSPPSFCFYIGILALLAGRLVGWLTGWMVIGRRYIYPCVILTLFCRYNIISFLAEPILRDKLNNFHLLLNSKTTRIRHIFIHHFVYLPSALIPDFCSTGGVCNKCNNFIATNNFYSPVDLIER